MPEFNQLTLAERVFNISLISAGPLASILGAAYWWRTGDLFPFALGLVLSAVIPLIMMSINLGQRRPN